VAYDPKALRKTVDEYCDSVLSGLTVAGKSEVRAIQRHRRDLEKLDDYVFRWDIAAHHVAWFDSLRFVRGVAAGEPFKLNPAQQTMTAILFGWRRADDPSRRRFTKCYLSMARGNGKSPYAAGLATQLFTCDLPRQQGAEVVNVATTRKQAKEYVWIPSVEFLQSIKDLEPFIAVRRGDSEIEFRHNATVGKFYPLGSDSNNLDGGSYHAAIVDELHAMREKHRELIEKVDTGLKGENSLQVVITTAGSDHSVLWKPEYDYATKVLRGIVDHPGYFAYIFECDKDDDPFDESVWQKANPLLGTAVSMDKLRDQATAARHNPVKRNQFERYYLNRPVSSREKLISTELWANGNGAITNLAGRECFGGLDKGWRDDLASLYWIFPLDNPDDDELPFYELVGRSWIPEDTPRDLTKPPFPELIESGELIVTPGNVTDHRAVISYAVEWAKSHQVRTIAADPANARTELTELEDTYGIDVYQFRQSCDRYNEPTNKLLDLLAAGRIRHGGSRLLAWAADNVVGKYNAAGNIMPDKVKSGEKIDPIVATIMAVSESMFAVRGQRQSVYEGRGIREL
jgi:phage terminase large subunit-like protein